MNQINGMVFNWMMIPHLYHGKNAWEITSNAFLQEKVVGFWSSRLVEIPIYIE